MVISAWLSSLTLALLSHLPSTVLPSICKLSPSGTAQLVSDLGYLSNVLSALGVGWGELERWKEVGEVGDEEGRERVGRESGEVGGEGAGEVWGLVARLRGW